MLPPWRPGYNAECLPHQRLFDRDWSEWLPIFGGPSSTRKASSWWTRSASPVSPRRGDAGFAQSARYICFALAFARAGASAEPAGLRAADPLDQLDAVHARHLEIRYHNVEVVLGKKFQSLVSAGSGEDVVTKLLEQRFARDQTLAVVVDQQDFGSFRRGWGGGVSHANAGEVIRPVTQLSTLLHQVVKRRD